jgi:hypothetical protein
MGRHVAIWSAIRLHGDRWRRHSRRDSNAPRDDCAPLRAKRLSFSTLTRRCAADLKLGIVLAPLSPRTYRSRHPREPKPWAGRHRDGFCRGGNLNGKQIASAIVNLVDWKSVGDFRALQAAREIAKSAFPWPYRVISPVRGVQLAFTLHTNTCVASQPLAFLSIT